MAHFKDGSYGNQQQDGVGCEMIFSLLNYWQNSKDKQLHFQLRKTSQF